MQKKTEQQTARRAKSSPKIEKDVINISALRDAVLPDGKDHRIQPRTFIKRPRSEQQGQN